MPSYPVPFAFLCLSSKITKYTVEALDHFEDNDGNFELGAAPQDRTLEV